MSEVKSGLENSKECKARLHIDSKHPIYIRNVTSSMPRVKISIFPEAMRLMGKEKTFKAADNEF